jgi:D-glycero-D-manno-heptose 1,7-bisphosphate phosphatase
MSVSSQTGEPMVPVLYLDIDGTVRHGKDELGHFVNVPEDVKVFDGVPKLLKQYKELGWRIVGVSNQGGIALGHMDNMLCAYTMDETNKQCGRVFDKIAWCAHHPNANDPEMAVCWCRKPRIGLIIETALDLAHRYGEIYPPHMALFVGDMDSDRETAENAGIEFLDASIWRGGSHLWGLTSPSQADVPDA